MNEHKPAQLNIKNAEAYELATEIVAANGGNLTTAVLEALREKALRIRREKTRDERLAALLDLGKRYRAQPNRDTRTPDEIIGYDENGLPT